MAHKRGDSFVKSYQLPEIDGVNWDTLEGRSQLRAFFYDGELITEFVFYWIDRAQRIFTIEARDTKNWPLGKHFYDVEFTDGDLIFSTDTKEIEITPDVTKEAL